jgi:hypothetical protein
VSQLPGSSTGRYHWHASRTVARSASSSQGFTLGIVPAAEPRDKATWTEKFKPYSERSFLHQYLDRLKFDGSIAACSLSSSLTAAALFDSYTQQYLDHAKARSVSFR